MVITMGIFHLLQLKVAFKIEIPKHFPLVLPRIYIHNFDHLGLYLPHVEKMGWYVFLQI